MKDFVKVYGEAGLNNLVTRSHPGPGITVNAQVGPGGARRPSLGERPPARTRGEGSWEHLAPEATLLSLPGKEMSLVLHCQFVDVARSKGRNVLCVLFSQAQK